MTNNFSKYKITLLLFTLLLLNGISTNANKNIDFNFSHITIQDGLKNSRVVSTLQDDYGYMWFATHHGIEKFNGSELVHFDLAFDSTFYAQDNIANCIEKSSDHDILCGTKGGNIYYLDRKHNIFKPLLPESERGDMYSIVALKTEKGKGIWIGNSSSLYFYNTSTKKKNKIEELSTGVTVFCEIDSIHMWLATPEGLKLLDKSSSKLVKLEHSSSKSHAIEKLDIMSMIPLADNKLVVCTRSSEAYVIGYANNKIELLAHKQFTIDNKTYPIRDVVESPEKRLFFALDGAGLLSTDLNLDNEYLQRADDDNDNSLSSNGLYDLYYGKDNILWVTSYGGGVNFYDPNKKPFNIINHIPYVDNSLRNNTVQAIIEGADNKIWYGTNKGLSIYDPSTLKWNHIPWINATNVDPIQVMNISKDKDDNMWVATYGNGLIKVDASTYKKEFFKKSRSGYFQTETDFFYNNITDSYNRIWAGGIRGGVTIIDPKRKETKHINISNVRSFYQDGNQMMIGTLFGLFIVDMQNFKVTRPNNSKLIENRIITIDSHPSKDIIYFGTDQKGIIAWNKKTNSNYEITTKNGLPSNYIRAINWDNDDQMWVATTGGLAHFNSTDIHISNYYIIDGLAGIEFAENASCKLESGELYFGGLNGVTHFYPNTISNSNQITRPILTGIKLFGKNLKIKDDGPLYEHVNLQEGIDLDYNQNSINLLFSAIGYSTPQKINYRWKLEGFDKQWNNSTGVKEAIYSKLPSGTYTFKVMCTNDDNVWQDDIKEFNIKIDQPFWKKPMAYLVYMIVLIILILLILHYSNTIVHEKHYAEKQQFFITIAHDLRTPLSLIKLPIDKMIESNKEENGEFKNLNLVKRNIDRLTNLVNQLLDFQKSDLHKMKLQVEKLDIVGFVNERIKLFESLAKEKDIKLTFTSSTNSKEIWFDKGKMEKIMYNLLSNAIKYTPKGGNVLVAAIFDAKNFKLTVSDDGEGIPKNQQQKIFQRYYRATNAINSLEVGSGIGLVLTKQLIELHHGKISFKSELDKGTSFTFFIPSEKKNYAPEDFKTEIIKEEQAKPITSLNSGIENVDESDSEVSNKIKILLVEDNPELLESLSIELASDYHVITARNGEVGLQQVKKEMPDLVISDVMMPVMNGHQLCLKLKGDMSVCHIPIILLTALDSVDYKREGLDYGADAYLEKPFDLKMLRSQIVNLLRNRSILKQKFLIPSSTVTESSPTNTDQVFLEKIQHYVIENLDNDKLSVESTAKELGMSRPVLYRKIKALTDFSPQQFVMNIKLKEAARIMKEENRNISETAFMVGFSDPKYFSQIFKKHFGMTPSQYIKQ